MNSLLSYYYGFFADNIIKKNNDYYFNIGLDRFIFSKINVDRHDYNSLYKLNIEILKYNRLFHEIIPNKYNHIITPINNEFYLLFKINIKNNRPINIIDLLKMPISIGYLPVNNDKQLNYSDWVKMWKQKINYFEYYTEKVKSNNYLLSELVNYFIGMGENAISYIQDTLNMTRGFNNGLVIQHNRIKEQYTLLDLYNPLNLVFDNRVRDISEYFKDNMIKKECEIAWIKKNYITCSFDEIESRLLFGRMLFPSFFFDNYEFFVNNEIDEGKLLDIINQIERYEKSIKYLYEVISANYKIPVVKWLVDKQ